MRYKTHADSDSLYNTPNCWAIYCCGKVFRYLLDRGGLEAMDRRNREKAAVLYDFLDSSRFFSGAVRKEDWSLMNVPFVTPSPEQDAAVVALLLVVSLGVTLAMEDVLANVAGGLVILSAPFAIGDYIEVSGAAGTVDKISVNYTKLLTPNGQIVVLPNKSLAASQITNYTALGRRRIVWKLGAAYDAPTKTVKDACRKAIAATENILADPAPAAYLSAYGESSIEYSIYCWAPFDSYWPTYYALWEKQWETFDQASVQIPYNHLNVHILDR